MEKNYITSRSLGGAKTDVKMGVGITIGIFHRHDDFWSSLVTSSASQLQRNILECCLLLAKTLRYRMSKYGALPCKYLASVKFSVVLTL